MDGGGSERQLWQLACGVSRDLFDPSLYLLHRRGRYLKSIPDDLKVFDFGANPPKGLPFPGAIRSAQIRHLENVIGATNSDVLYDRTFHMTLVTAPACYRQNCPRVSTIVSPPSQNFGGSKERFKFLKKRILKAAYQSSNSTTIAVSEGVASDASDFYGISKNRFTVIPSPVDISEIRRLAELVEYSAIPRPPTFCVVGRMSREKGQGLSLHAFHKLLKANKQFQGTMEFVGDGPDRRHLEELAASLGIREYVRFHGFLENPYPVIKNATTLVLPSRYEGLPNVVMEAMALNTGVIATKCSSSIEKLLGNNERGAIVELAANDDQVIRDLQFAMQHSLEDGAAWRERIQLASQYVHANHDLAAWLEKMSEVLEAISRQSKPATSR